jgi:hypothetical protein
MDIEQQPKPALPLLALLALASALGIAVAVTLAAVAMLLAAPAYAGDGSALLERQKPFAPVIECTTPIEPGGTLRVELEYRGGAPPRRLLARCC